MRSQQEVSAEPSPVTQHPAKFSGHNSCESGEINFSKYHMTSH